MKTNCRADGPIHPLHRVARLFAVLSLVAMAAAAAADPVEFDIPAQPVPAALGDFARQAGVQLFFISDGYEDVQANAVWGRHTRQRALDLLLAGTGLSASLSTESGVKVRAVDNSARVQAAGSPLHAVGDVPSKAVRRSAHASATGDNGGGERPPFDNGALPIEELVVTGSNIRGVETVGVDVITLDREYIELSGISTTTELIQSVPQNFGLGNEAVEAVGIVTNPGRNWGFSSSVNFRGLGSDSTLVLLNGRRSASGGKSGNIVDLNTIPLAAIERIEVLSDGASAIYGSDAVGGVVNVILRENYEGAETSIRYAPGTSEIDEFQFNQMFGTTWNSGSVLFSYEYYDRSELRAADRVYTRDSDLTSLGGGNHSIVGSNPGNIDRFIAADGTRTDGTWAIPAGQDGTALTPADLLVGDINLQNIREGTYVLPRQRRRSAFVSATEQVSDGIELFGEARYSTRDYEFRNLLTVRTLTVPDTNPFFVDPIGDSASLRIQYSLVDDYGPTRSSGEVDAAGAVLGATFSLGNSWQIEVSALHGVEHTDNLVDKTRNSVLLDAALADPNPATAFNPFGDGSFTNPDTLEAIQGYATIRVESALTTFDVLAEGNLFELPGGVAKLAVGGQFRDQSLSSENTFFLTTPEPVPGFEGDIFASDREVLAGFAEIYLPLVADRNARPGLNSLSVSIAGRYEKYSDFGDTFDPKLGISWSPSPGLEIRGTVGTSFRAPLLTELITAQNRVISVPLPDFASPTGSTPSILLLGNAPDLQPQEGMSWTAGFDVTPASIPRLRVGLTYFSTEVDDLIRVPVANVISVLLDPVTHAPIITWCTASDPCDMGTLQAYFNDPVFEVIGPAVGPAEIGAIVNARLQNVAKSELSGLDLNAKYAFETSAGDFELSMYASYLFEFRNRLLNGPWDDKVDTIANPNSLNLRGSLSWSSGGASVALTARHIGNYLDNLASVECSLDPCAVDSWTTWDLVLGYDFGARATGLLDGLRLSLSVQNLLDDDPPFVNIASEAVGFDAINSNPMGRFAAIQLSKAW